MYKLMILSKYAIFLICFIMKQKLCFQSTDNYVFVNSVRLTVYNVLTKPIGENNDMQIKKYQHETRFQQRLSFVICLVCVYHATFTY